MKEERYWRADDMYDAWEQVRDRRRIVGDSLRVVREGKGSYIMEVYFDVPGKVAVDLQCLVSPCRNPAALIDLVATANEADPELPFDLPDLYALKDPFLHLRAVVPWTDGGVTVAELEACRVRLVARMDAYYDRIRAIGRLPTVIHVDDDGVGRMYVDAGRVREQEEQKARLAAAAAGPSSEKPKDTKGE